MNRGDLADLFTGVAAKRLSAVETDPDRSNQHRFNDTGPLVRMLGTPDGTARFPATFIRVEDDEEATETDRGHLSWYDARRAHPSRTEWRLYYEANRVLGLAVEGDLLIIARQPDRDLLCIVAAGDSTTAGQLLWLFGLDDPSGRTFVTNPDLASGAVRLDFAARLVLAHLGLEPVDGDDTDLELMLRAFGPAFPPTAEFSAYARRRSAFPDFLEDPDSALLDWMLTEEKLFRTLERHLVADRLEQGFAGDIDGFLAFSL